MHNLVCLRYAYGVYLSQSHELGERAKNRFDRTLSFAFHVPALRTVDPFNISLIFLPKVGHRELLLFGSSPQTTRLYRAVPTLVCRTAVLLFQRFRSGVAEYFFKGNDLSLGTDIMVMLFIIFKTIGSTFIGAVRWNKTLQIDLFQKRIVLAPDASGL